MKKIIFTLSILLVANTLLAQTSIQNFEQLMTALNSGKSVKAVIYYGKCKLFSDGKEQPKSPNAIGGMKLDTYEYFDSSIFKGKVP